MVSRRRRSTGRTSSGPSGRRQDQAASAYIPGSYDGAIDLVWAEGRENVERVDPTHGWWRVARQVRTHQIVAHHIGLITNDLPKLAETLRAILDGEPST